MLYCKRCLKGWQIHFTQQIIQNRTSTLYHQLAVAAAPAAAAAEAAVMAVMATVAAPHLRDDDTTHRRTLRISNDRWIAFLEGRRSV